MSTQTLDLSGSCRLELTTYGDVAHRSVSLDYTEHRPDAWYSDHETSIDLDAPKAREIIAFLHKAFPELAPKPLTIRQIAEATGEFGHVRSDHTIGIARTIESAHNITGA